MIKESKFHKRQEELVDILCTKTGNDDRGFFRIMVAYKFAEIASNMRANIEYLGTKNIPTNMYALDLAPSGYSKNASMNLLEKQIFRKFKDGFMLKTFKEISDDNLNAIAGDYSVLTGLDIVDAKMKIDKEYGNLPKYLYSFGSSTPEGFKAMRAKLSMAGIGATSNVVDEIGSNLQGNQETMTVQLEAYDMGESKQKLIKVDSNSDMRGSVPSNLFAFGTQSKLLDGGIVEKQFFEMLETGYGRRFFIGFVNKHQSSYEKSAEDIYNEITSSSIDMSLLSHSKYYEELCDTVFYNQTIKVSKDVAIKLIDYRNSCDKRADSLKEHEEILKAVIKHSYWRALKLAGAYAFIDKETEISEELLDNAIALAEESIVNFKTMLSRDKAYVRLAKYLAGSDGKVTQVDLIEDLPFYRGSETQKREMMQLATAYGYNNNIIIKNTIKDGIEFLEGETLKEVDNSRITCSWSKDIAKDYKSAISKFENLHQLVSANGFHYCSHSFNDGHRTSEKAIKGFNLIILDVDSGLNIDVCKTLLKEYKFLISTTKRHTDDNNRFRILIPMSHTLEFTPSEYKSFMNNVFDWLPFEVDSQTSDIARKWQSHKGEYWYNDGNNLDVLPFIPDTPKAKKQKDGYGSMGDADKLQRWFLMNYREEDGRNNTLTKYALALSDDGMSSDNIRHCVYDMNSKFEQSISEREIESTTMKTILKKEFEKEV